MPEKDQLSDEAIISMTRAEVRRRDPVPPGTADLAHLALEFAHLLTIAAESPAPGQLVGVRSGSAVARREARHNGVFLSWEPGERSIVGVVRAASDLDVSIHLQQLSSSEAVIAISDEGAFDCALPTHPFRFVVRGDIESWATDWQR